MLRDPDLARLRTAAGVPAARRGGKLATFTETFESDDGKTLQVRWGKEGAEHARFVPKPIPRGNNVFDVFIDPADYDKYTETEQKRASLRGEVIESRNGPPAGVPPGPTPGTTVEILMRSRPGSTPAWLWPSLAARIALGFMRRGVDLGLVGEEPMSTMKGLSDLAQNREITTDLWDPDQVSLWPSKPLAADPVFGCIGPSEHFICIHARDPGCQPVLSIVLFGARLYELDLPDVKTSQGACWLLDTRRVRFREGPMTRVDQLLKIPSSDSQVPLFLSD